MSLFNFLGALGSAGTGVVGSGLGFAEGLSKVLGGQSLAMPAEVAKATTSGVSSLAKPALDYTGMLSKYLAGAGGSLLSGEPMSKGMNMVTTGLLTKGLIEDAEEKEFDSGTLLRLLLANPGMLGG